MRKRADEIQSGDPLSGISVKWEGMPDYKSVTVPNIASLTFPVTEGDKTLLPTGDAHYDHLIAGLERAGLLDDEGRIHLSVLKVQRHGSEHNMDAHFAEHVTADR